LRNTPIAKQTSDTALMPTATYTSVNRLVATPAASTARAATTSAVLNRITLKALNAVAGALTDSA
jgi:hypothetical protein